MFDSFQFEDVFKPEVEVKTVTVVDAIRKTGVLANKCLEHEDFMAYKAQFEVAQANLISAMIMYTHEFFSSPSGDMAKYGAKMAMFITKLNDLRVLLGQVESDVKKAERTKQ